MYRVAENWTDRCLFKQYAIIYSHKRIFDPVVMMNLNVESGRHLRAYSIGCSPHLAEHLVGRTRYQLLDIPDQNRSWILRSEDNTCFVIGQDR